jgi:peptidoglycan/LPS O-acetylase OafA/YrhL
VARWIAVAAGLILVAIAFVAATNVADTREGLIAEVVTLLAGLAGVLLLIYGLVPRRPAPRQLQEDAERTRSKRGPRSANDLVIGSAGLLIAAVLLTGLVMSGGWQWALVGGLLLLPMIAGCVYLCAAFAAARERDWTIDLRRLVGRR